MVCPISGQSLAELRKLPLQRMGSESSATECIPGGLSHCRSTMCWDHICGKHLTTWRSFGLFGHLAVSVTCFRQMTWHRGAVMPSYQYGPRSDRKHNSLTT